MAAYQYILLYSVEREGEGGTFVPRLNFKSGRFANWRRDHVAVGIFL